MNARLELAAPSDLSATRFDLGEEQFVILEWPVSRPPAPAALSRAERTVLDLLLLGLSNAEIAKRRGRSVRTIANQVAAIFRKLGVRSRLELFAATAGGAGRASSLVATRGSAIAARQGP